MQHRRKQHVVRNADVDGPSGKPGMGEGVVDRDAFARDAGEPTIVRCEEVPVDLVAAFASNDVIDVAIAREDVAAVVGYCEDPARR